MSKDLYCVGDSLMVDMQEELCASGRRFAQGGAVASANSCRPHTPWEALERPVAAALNALSSSCPLLRPQLDQVPPNSLVAVSIGGNGAFRSPATDGLAATQQALDDALESLVNKKSHAFVLGMAGGAPPVLVGLLAEPAYLRDLDAHLRKRCAALEGSACTYVDITHVPYFSDDGMHFDAATRAGATAALSAAVRRHRRSAAA